MDRPPGDGSLAAPSVAADAPLVSRSRPVDDGAVELLLDVGDGPRVNWASPGDGEFTGSGVAAAFVASGSDRFDRIKDVATERFDDLEHDGPRRAWPRAFGGFAFHDEQDGSSDGTWSGFDAASFVVPRVQVSRTEDGTWVTVVGTDTETVTDSLERWTTRLETRPSANGGLAVPGVGTTSRSTSREEWTRQVDAALDRIDRGELEKVVLAQALSAELGGPIDLTGTLDRLRDRYPNCYRFAIDRPNGGTFFGAPPERLVSLRGSTLETEALAGSVPRGETPAEDEAQVEQMVESEKVQREHGLVVDAIRDQLEPLAADVRIEDQTVRKLATIQHLWTPIEADLDPGRHVLDLVAALHPTPAVGGVPQNDACAAIRELESFDRGWYAGPVGWFDGDGDGEFAVGIRAGVATETTVTCFGGNGIVADSDPDEEWTEVQLKLHAVLDELR